MSRTRSTSQQKRWRRRPQRSPLALERMFDEVAGKLSKVPAPPVLYHYTSWQGAEGILASRRFWATAHDSTNDEAELQSADSSIVDVARELQRRVAGLAARTLELFIAQYSQLRVSNLMRVCLACFSIARDTKEQWQKYGDEGRGVCLGIRVLNEPGPEGQPSALVEVDYLESSWRASVEKHFREVCSMLAGASVSNENCELGISALNRIAAITSISAKQASWASEKEFRHVTLVPKSSGIRLLERESKGRNVRYLPVLVRARGKRIALDEIIIGPNHDPSEGLKNPKLLLAAAGYRIEDEEYPRVGKSTVEPWGEMTVPKWR